MRGAFLVGCPSECFHDPDRDGAGGELDTVPGKLFASFYALFSGLVFITAVALLLALVFHRFLHKFHLDSESREDDTTERRAETGGKPRGSD
jgi:hypothetical protein